MTEYKFFEKELQLNDKIMINRIQLYSIVAMLILLFANVSTAIAQHNHQMPINNVQDPEEEFYKIVTVPIPKDILLEVSGLAQLPDGRLAVATRKGEIWFIENVNMEVKSEPDYKLFASGLHTPMGLIYKDGAFYTAQRAELTKITDSNGDDKADSFETIATWPLSGNYCEYNHGPILAPDGNFYINFNLGDNGMSHKEPFYGEMGSHVPWRGWMVQITPDGKLNPYAAGLRSPAGIGMDADGEIFYTENQGGWVGTDYLTHVDKGDFFGHPSSLKSAGLPGSTVKLDISDIPRNNPLLHELVGKVPDFKMPSVRSPHGILGISLTQPVPDTTKGGFGPFERQMFVGDEGQAKIMRFFLEKVNGEYQGAVFPFKEGFESGILRMAWGMDNSLLVGMSDRGWNSSASKRYGLQRLVWTGKTPFEIKTIKAKPDGFELEFTLPVDPITATDFSSYEISGFEYAYHMEYGSDVFDKKECKIKGIKLSEDGLTARLILDGLREGYMHEIKCEGVKSTMGNPLLHDFGYYSLNSIPSGDKLSLTDPSLITAEHPYTVQTASTKKGTGKELKPTPIVEKHQTSMPTSWKNGPDITITIGTKPGLKYDLEDFKIKPNAKVKLVFVNNDDMQHNLVIVLPNSADEVGQLALKLGLDGSAMNYVPKSSKVLSHTKLLQPRSRETIYFTAPSKEGNYEYVCTYPGHYLYMRGTMFVSNSNQ